MVSLSLKDRAFCDRQDSSLRLDVLPHTLAHIMECHENGIIHRTTCHKRGGDLVGGPTFLVDSCQRSSGGLVQEGEMHVSPCCRQWEGFWHPWIMVNSCAAVYSRISRLAFRTGAWSNSSHLSSKRKSRCRRRVRTTLLSRACTKHRLAPGIYVFQHTSPVTHCSMVMETTKALPIMRATDFLNFGE